MVTPAVQDYLAAIHLLEAEGATVIGARLAEHLGVSAPAVAEALRRLGQEGHVTLDERKVIRLTATGRAIAEATLRRRRVVERWLTDAVGLDWSEVHDVAHRLEHAVTPELVERLFVYLGQPTTCPHGNPIPGSDAGADPGIALDQAAVDVDLIVQRISEAGERCDELLAHLGRLGLRPGVRLRVVEHAPWAGTSTVQCGERRIVLGAEAARRIRVSARAGSEEDDPAADAGCATVARVSVRSVHGTCQAGHQIGEAFVLDCRTPAGLCGEAFHAIFPLVKRLRGQVQRGGSRVATIDIPCPEEGSVIFRVEVQQPGTQAANPEHVT